MDNPNTLATSGIQDTDDDQQKKPKYRKLERRERDDLKKTNKKHKHEVELRCSQRVGSSYFLI